VATGAPPSGGALCARTKEALPPPSNPANVTTTRRSGLVVVLSGLLVAAAAAPAGAYPRPGTTERVSVTAAGAEIGLGATSPSVSDDGRYVAFVTPDDYVVPDDTNGQYDVFVRDRVRGTTERVSVGSDGAGQDAMSLMPNISSEGRYVLFTTTGAFDPRDTHLGFDPYIRDLETGTTTLAVVGSDGKALSWGVGDPHMSDDGRVVTFSTGYKVLPADTNDTFDVYAYHRDTGAMELVSATPTGTSGNGESYWNDVSDDGRYAVWHSFASNLVAGDTNAATDVFVRDLVTDETIRVSVSSQGVQGNASSFLPAISDDGRSIAFVSYASNLVPADTNPINDVFVHDRVTRRTERVSVASDGVEASNTGLTSSWEPSISSDGRYVAFASSASNLVPDDTNAIGDFFVHDRATGWTERVSIASDGTQMTSNNSSAEPSVGGGRYVAFTANAPNLVAGDANDAYDVFLRDRGPALGVGRLDVATSGTQVSVAGWATYSGTDVVAAADPADDGTPVAPDVPPGELGGELVGARVTYRPEPGELLVRWDVTKLPGVAGPPLGVDANSIVSGGVIPSAAGAPAVLYGLALRTPSARFEVRAMRASASGSPPAAPLFALFRCDDGCTEVGRLRGSFGTAGEGLRAVVPLSTLGIAEGDALTEVRAYAAVGEAAAGAVQPLDEVTLGSAAIPARTLAAAVAEADEIPDAFPHAIATGDGASFAAVFDAGELPPEARVWVRVCLGQDCSLTARVP
jgi:Tol biopolymer transport system component